jgi:hypothetical protein
MFEGLFPINFQCANSKLQRMSRESSRSRTEPATDFQTYYPRSEDGGATLETSLLPVFKPGKTVEPSEKAGIIARGPRNTKILGKSTIASHGLN